MFPTRLFSTNGYVTQRIKLQRYQSIEEVPENYREPGIMSGYRNLECSASQAILSLFNATNETLNFWTHFIPTIYFVWQFCNLACTMPLFSDPYLFPFVCYMVASCCYPLMSCIAHAFSCLSTTAAHICFFLDYAALSLYSWGVAVLYFSYCLPNSMIQSSLANYFLPVATANAIFATVIACYSRFCNFPIMRKSLRLCAFIVPYIWDSLPLVWRLITCDSENDTCSESVWPHAKQFLSVTMASFFYASHIPERLAPGKFDIIGHSHNLLHLFGIIATNEQLQGSLIDLQGRKSSFAAIEWTTPQYWTTLVTPIIVILNILIITCFTLMVNRLSNERPLIDLNKGKEKIK